MPSTHTHAHTHTHTQELCNFGELVREPIETFKETLAVCRAARLNVPRSLAEVGQLERVRKLGGGRRVWKILLVGKHQQDRVPELFFRQHFMQFLARFHNTLAITAVHDKNDPLRVLEIVAPQRSDLVLTPYIPHRETNVLVFDSLDVKT